VEALEDRALPDSSSSLKHLLRESVTAVLEAASSQQDHDVKVQKHLRREAKEKPGLLGDRKAERLAKKLSVSKPPSFFEKKEEPGGGVRVSNGPSLPGIILTNIGGAYSTQLHDFTSQEYPGLDARIFVDTDGSSAGGILNVKDVQRLRIEVQVTLPDNDPWNYLVRWELRDPDDPAVHPLLDNNDVPTPRGGDNYDRFPTQADLVPHWFSQLNHAISHQSEAPGINENTVIGRAKTVITGAAGSFSSSVHMHYSDETGDNFIGTAVLEKAGVGDVGLSQSGILTVWRKRLVRVFAMAKQNDDVQAIPVGVVVGDPVAACVTPGANIVLETLVLGGDDYYLMNQVVVGNNMMAETTANSGGNNFYPANLGILADLQSALDGSYTGTLPDKNAYLDLVATDANLALPFRPVIDTDNLEWAQYLEANVHGNSGLGHVNYTYDVIGTARLLGVNGGLLNGTAVHQPHVGVDVWGLKTNPGDAVHRKVNGIVIHELGHTLTKDHVPGTHDGHTNGDTQLDCIFEQTLPGASGLGICEKHIRMLRENITRGWPEHKSNQNQLFANDHDSD
jgi:hypothetical protein